MANFITPVSWETIVSNVQLTWNVITDPPTHIYTCEVSPINPNDKGSGDLVVGYYLVDYLGNLYEITNVVGSTITVYDVNEGAQNTDEYTAPYQDQIGFIYRPKSDGSINLSQSDLIRLYPTARDLINQIDNNSIDVRIDDLKWSDIYNENVYDNLEYSLDNWHAHTQSAGRIWGGKIIDNGDGTVEVQAGGGLIKLGTGGPDDCPCDAGLLASSVSQNVYIEWDAVAALPLTDNAYNYVYIRGSDKTAQVTLDFYSIDFFNDFTVGRCYRSGTTSLIRLCGTNIWNFNRRVQLFGEEVFPVKRANGLIVGSTGTRNITMTQGILWAELVNRFVVNWGDPVRDFDSSIGDTFTYWYRVGTVWTAVPGSTQISNTQWNNTATGLVNFGGGLNRWGVHWVYVDHDAGVHVVYGTAEYGSLVASEAATPPSVLPGIVAAYSTVCARINIQKDTNILYIYSAFDLAFSASGVLDHGDLAGLTDDDHPQYYDETRGDLRYEQLLGNPLVDGYVLSSTTTGVRSWVEMTSGSSVSFGTEGQIPYTNSTDDDFDYSSKFTWNNTTGILIVDNIIQSSNSPSIGTGAQNLIIKAGDGILGEPTSPGGSLYISPGNPHDNNSLSGRTGAVFIGDPTYGKAEINLVANGSNTFVSLNIRPKGDGYLALCNTSTQQLYVFAPSYFSGDITFNASTLDRKIEGPSYFNQKPPAFIIKGGFAYEVPSGTTPYDGGDVHIYGGNPNGAGLRGDIYFGDSTTGYLKEKTTEDQVVYYDETTGLLSYGDGGGSSIPYTYTNATAMPTAVGGFAAGTTFTDMELDDLWTGLLYPYQSPAFSAFTMSGQSTPLEVGVALTGGNRTFTWSTTNSSNINTNSIVIRDMNTSTDLATGLANDGTEVVDIGSAITKTTTGDTHVWRISAVNTNSVTFTRNYTVTWLSPYYDGVGDPGLSVAQIQALGKELLAKGSRAVMFNPVSQVYYFAYPASYGLLTSIKDPNNFETIGDWTVHTVDFTNNPPDYNGGTVSYYVYEFNNLTTQTNFIITFIY